MNKTIGIVGNGVVGSATGKAFVAKGCVARYWDIKPGLCTHSLKDVIDTDAVFICLPTPAYPDGSCDVSTLIEFFTNGPYGERERQANYVIRSTVPVGFTSHISSAYHYPNMYHWPEFLTMRTADEEALNPRCLIVGKTRQRGNDDPVINLLGDTFGWNFRTMSTDESEAVKLFMNTWLAIKNAAFNEFRLFADKAGLDWDKVLGGMLADQRLHPVQTQVPGPDGKRGFGGPCLPKDLRSYVRQSFGKHLDARMGLAALGVNGKVRGE